MRPPAVRVRPPWATFAIYAAVSLFPVLALGVVLAASFHAVATARGVDEGRTEGLLLARAAIDPLLGPAPLSGGLSPSVRGALSHVLGDATRSGELLQAELVDLDGDVVYSKGPAQAPFAHAPSHSLAPTARLAVLGPTAAGGRPSSNAGREVVEVMVPVVGSSARPLGSLEMQLPYAPIAAQVSAGLRGWDRNLIFGLAALYLSLFAVSGSMSRRLRQQVQLNRHQAEHDILTGLANRALFRQRTEAAVAHARRHKRPTAIAVLDLDRFKDVNDTLGHQNGDRLLVELAQRLASFVRHGDSVARLGGDEFGLILVDVDEPLELLGHLRRLIEREFEVAGLPLSVESSIGFVVTPDDGTDVDELRRKADIAMYVAKASHAGVVAFEPEQDHYDPASLGLVSELRHAIEAGELTLHYQPKMTLSDGSTSSIEALVRWNHPQHGLLYPDRFLSLAEQTDLIDKLTEWVLSTALGELRELGAAGAHLNLAVNVSARNLARVDFAERVVDTLELAGVPSRQLTIEITETALLADPTRAAAVLRALDAAGVTLSLDDFGKGQTSLGYLSSLPVRELKIDQGFVTDMLQTPAHAAIVRSIIDLGHNLALEVVGEGVETGEVLRALRDSGCNTAQGFLLARPMPLAALGRWLAADALRERLSA
jgi:diguanylate cyclase (GGDEF)-like protein